jgi:hypothetical protein
MRNATTSNFRIISELNRLKYLQLACSTQGNARDKNAEECK